MLSKVYNFLKKEIDLIENSQIPFIYFILTFISATTIRTFLEWLSYPNLLSDNQALTLIHYNLLYTVLAMSLILLFYFITKNSIVKISKIIFPSFIILILAPILDFIISKGNSPDMTYLLPDYYSNLLLRFFTFFGNLSTNCGVTPCGVTPGIRIEIFIVLLATFFYFYLKKINVVKNLLGVFIFYSIIFIYSAFPFIMKALLQFLNLKYEFSDQLFINFYLLIIFLIGILLFYLNNKNLFKAIMGDIRLTRTLHFELMFFLGFIIGIKQNMFIFSADNFFYLIFIPISILFAILFSIVSNNIIDYDIDKISNKERPLTKGEVSLDEYKKVLWPFLFISLVFAAAVNFSTFFIILVFISGYFIYSMPPLRLKRVPFFSKIFISLNSLILVILGVIISGKNISFIPSLAWFIFIFLVGFTSTINFIDIKDYEGDKKEGIKTLPVLLGLKNSKLIIGSFFIVAYSFIAYLIFNISMNLSLFFIFLGIMQFYFINKKKYSEKPVFLIYLSSLLLVILLIIFI